MNKKVLPLAVSAVAAVTMTNAHASMYLDEGGLGEALIFPFYSAENGNNTLINLANTTSDHKAVKVRILEGENSYEVLDFNLYMSPNDHFSFSISATDAGGGKLMTADKSCTVPAIPAEGQEFYNYAYVGDVIKDKDGKVTTDNTSITRSASGYVEVIEMGQLDPKFDPKGKTGIDPLGKMSAAAAMTHDADGVPADCSLLVAAWSKKNDVKGKWYGEAEAGKGVASAEFIGEPDAVTAGKWQSNGGLYGYGVVINVADGAAFGYDAVAIDDLVPATKDAWILHYSPGDLEPSLKDPDIDTNAIHVSNGKSKDLSFGTGYGAAGIGQLQSVNSLIMTSVVMNDYVTDASIGAQTDWLFTFPTKKYHVATDPTMEPFSEPWATTVVSACEPTRLSSWDREESTPPAKPGEDDDPIFSPPPPPGTPTTPGNDDIPLCYESTVLQFGAESASESSNLALGIAGELDAADGWASVTFAQAAALDTVLDACDHAGSVVNVANAGECIRRIQADGGETLDGLPVIGLAVQRYVNGNAGGAGVLANYAAATTHKTSVITSGI